LRQHWERGKIWKRSGEKGEAEKGKGSTGGFLSANKGEIHAPQYETILAVADRPFLAMAECNIPFFV